MTAQAHDLAVLQNDDLVRVANGAHTLGDYERRGMGELARERAKLGRASTRRVVKLVASSIALLVTLSLALAMVAGLDLPSDGEVPAVMALVASAVAFALSLRHFLYARRANAAIDRVLGRA